MWKGLFVLGRFQVIGFDLDQTALDIELQQKDAFLARLGYNRKVSLSKKAKMGSPEVDKRREKL